MWVYAQIQVVPRTILFALSQSGSGRFLRPKGEKRMAILMKTQTEYTFDSLVELQRIVCK